MKSILDASFRYTSSLSTDVRKTFERIRREQRRQARRGADEAQCGARAGLGGARRVSAAGGCEPLVRD